MWLDCLPNLTSRMKRLRGSTCFCSVDHLTQFGAMEAALLYESPFTDITPQGPETLFSAQQIDELVAVLEGVKNNATAA